MFEALLNLFGEELIIRTPKTGLCRICHCDAGTGMANDRKRKEYPHSKQWNSATIVLSGR